MISWPLTIDPAVMKDSSTTLRKLLGCSSVAIGFEEEWLGTPAELRDLCVSPVIDY